ncbi:MAG: sugar-binding domain-containing protein, partial [Armatimonadota bacterium]
MPTPTNLRERLLMDPGWKFQLGEAEGPAVINHGDTYGSVKAGHAGGRAGKGFDHSTWRSLDLPHDFIVEQPYDRTANVSHGFRQGAVGWYRKSFDLPAEDLGKRLWLEFDGVFRDCTVWLNGFLLGSHVSGYTGFHYDITDVADYGGENVVAVRVDATAFEGWWYEGGGIYRHVWLSKTPALHAERWGIFAAPRLSEDFSAAEVAVETAVVNAGTESVEAVITSAILDPDGNLVVEETSSHPVAAGSSATLKQALTVTAPRLWDLDHPQLYTLRTTIAAFGSDLADVTETPFGIRHIHFDPEGGFFLNGNFVKLQGTCNHQDHAGVGIAMPDAVQEYRVRRLLDMGGNAYRCAHNPPAPELLDACDRLGMLVMDENRHLSSAAWGLDDLESMVKRDRNHP